jgi:hypothetical protein
MPNIRTFVLGTDLPEEDDLRDEESVRLERESLIWETMPDAARQYLQPGKFDPLRFAICFSYWWDFETDTWKEPTPLPATNIALQGGGVGVATSMYERFVEQTG